VKVETVELITSAASARGFAQDGLPQLAMIGRSNVGKSSLINALTRTRIARTSVAPGKTRLLNFYRVQPAGRRFGAFYFVDLPGYGFARGARASGGFDTLVSEYFACPPAAGGRREGDALPHGNPPGKGPFPAARPLGPTAAVLVVDSRHPGLASDVAALRWLTARGRDTVVAASKVDKLTRAERLRAEQEWSKALGVPILPVSAATGEGLDELWKRISRLLSGPTGPSAPPRVPTPRT